MSIPDDSETLAPENLIEMPSFLLLVLFTQDLMLNGNSVPLTCIIMEIVSDKLQMILKNQCD